MKLHGKTAERAVAWWWAGCLHVLAVWAMAAPAGAAEGGAVAAAPTDADRAVPVRLVRRGEGVELLRGGRPYFIRGAGGSERLDVLAGAGGNSIRTWGAEGLGETLDRAAKLGL